MAGGPADGQVVELQPMLDEYYSIMGWDAKGIPTPERLRELGLTEDKIKI
jgi:aldehyde:ferredoxin oxidoreductase